MPYIDADYYNNDYEGTPVSDAVLLNRMIKRASEQIDSIIGYKLQGVDFDKFAPFIHDQVKKATAAQVEFLAINGITSATVSEGGGGFSVGAYSENGMSSGAAEAPSYYDRYAITVVDYLKPTGLLYTGVCVHG
ncbi:Phage protein [Bacillus pseudomycoides]